ncbi:MAG: hypothetical protein QF707_02220 [Candidatus Poseidoniaceae archaeon]|nr:hypothetical protein [Candidatus Poseidoniaceae archaeon]MDP7202853.1 hypothetical protein [Candidatus Poseidoniaceae archaeon]
MSGLSKEVIATLANMDEYERLLAAESLSREHNIQMDALLVMVDDYIKAVASGQVPQTEQAQNINAGISADNFVAPAPDGVEMRTPTTAHHIRDAHRYRMKYDPSSDSQSRTQDITEAIICPHCKAPLGIPSIRPIKVSCPSCMMESTFYD